LSIGEDAFDIDTNGSLVGVLASDHSEAQTLVARSLQEGHILDPVHLTSSLAWQRAELGPFCDL
jgi:hypothetical protein